jgi:hypothetical protein
MTDRKPKKAKKCKSCREQFTPTRPLQSACGVQCAIALTNAGKEKVRKAKDAVERAEHRIAKDKIKTRSEWLHEAEKAVRDYRRLYELSIGSGCISCGKSKEEILAEQGWKTGGAFDAGHFLGKGARPELRMEPGNIWLQCKGCNAGSFKFARKGETVSQGYRSALIQRIGIEAVEALEADHTPRKYTIEDLKAIKAEYRAKVRELKKACA